MKLSLFHTITVMNISLLHGHEEENIAIASKEITPYYTRRPPNIDKGNVRRNARDRISHFDFEGNIFIQGEEGYETARFQYGTPSFHESLMSPGYILYATGDDDVIKAIAFCRENGLKMAIRTGGHQYSGFSSTDKTNFQLDLSQTYPKYDYDPNLNTLVSGVSNPLGEWAFKNAENEIYFPMGQCGTVYLGGHVQTGGWGALQRSWGLLSDRLDAFTIITADGEKRRIVKPNQGKTSNENNDLWFGVIGGGPSDFGVVTEYEFTPLKDSEHPNSAAYFYAFPFTKGNIAAVAKLMVEYNTLAADGTLPQDYEFFVTTGVNGKGGKHMPEMVKEMLREKGLTQAAGAEEVFPSLITITHFYTNKDGVEFFDEKWIKRFLDVAETSPVVAVELSPFPISAAIPAIYVFDEEREFPLPAIKRVQGTRSLSLDEWAESYANLVNEIYEENLGRKGLNLLSQMQIYAGGFTADADPEGLAAHSYRDIRFGYTRDVFYDMTEHPSAKEHAIRWQDRCDREWLGKGGIYSDEDIRVFWGTYGERDLSKIWPAYFDSDEDKYNRLKDIKAAFDPDEIFTASEFGIRP